MQYFRVYIYLLNLKLLTNVGDLLFNGVLALHGKPQQDIMYNLYKYRLQWINYRHFLLSISYMAIFCFVSDIVYCAANKSQLGTCKWGT